jgi:hypothetical protein
MKELIQMREARLQTQAMVDSLVQQRDMYKTMLDETNSAFEAVRAGKSVLADTVAHQSSASSASTTPSVSFATPAKAQTPGAGGVIGSPMAHDLQLKIVRLEDENRVMRERMIRLEEAEKLFSDALDKSRAECNTLRLQAATSSSDARFQKERAERLDEAVRSAQAQNNLLSQKRYELEKSISALMQDVRAKEDKAASANARLRLIEDELKRAQIDLEVLRLSESRLSSQLAEQREEVKRQVAVGDSIRRIEAGVASRLEEEKASLQIERDTLQSSLDSFRKEVANKELITGQRIASLTEDVRGLRAQLDAKAEELSSLRIDYVREQGVSKASQERSALLEKQLALAQERVGTLQGVAVTGSALANDLSSKELALEQAQGQVASLASQLAAAESHAEQYRRISVSTEARLKELQERSAATKEVFDAEIAKLKSTIQQQQDEINNYREHTKGSMSEIENLSEQLRTQAAEHLQRTKALEEEVRVARQQAESATAQIESLKTEITRHQNAAKQAHGNYERELQLHATAESTIRTYSDEIDALKQQIELEKTKFASMSASMITLETQLHEEKEKSKSSQVESNQQIDHLKATNELLHSQLHSLSQQVTKLHEGKGGSGSTSESSADEIKELRELMRIMKTEKDILETRLKVSESETARHLAAQSAAQRANDELRTQIRQLQEATAQSSVTHSQTQIAQLVSDSAQLKIVSESNAHLRSEMEALLAREATLNKTLEAVQNEVGPLKETIHRLTAQNAALEDANETMANDCGYWKDRLHQWAARYDNIDPEEHRMLQVKVEELTAQVERAQQELSSAIADRNALTEEARRLQTELATAASATSELHLQLDEAQNDAQVSAQLADAKSKELEALKATNEGIEKNANQLRDRLRGFKTVLDAKEKRATDAEEAMAKLSAEVAELQSQLANARTAASVVAKVAAVSGSAPSAGVGPSSAPPPPSGPPPVPGQTPPLPQASGPAPGRGGPEAGGRGGRGRGRGPAAPSGPAPTPVAAAPVPAAQPEPAAPQNVISPKPPAPETPAVEASPLAASTAVAAAGRGVGGRGPAPGRGAGRGRGGIAPPPPAAALAVAATPAVEAAAVPDAPAAASQQTTEISVPVPTQAPQPASELSVATTQADLLRQKLQQMRRTPAAPAAPPATEASTPAPVPASVSAPVAAAASPVPKEPSPVAPVAEEESGSQPSKRARVAEVIDISDDAAQPAAAPSPELGGSDLPASEPERELPVTELQRTYESSIDTAASESGLKRGLEANADEEESDEPAAKVLHRESPQQQSAEPEPRDEQVEGAVEEEEEQADGDEGEGEEPEAETQVEEENEEGEVEENEMPETQPYEESGDADRPSSTSSVVIMDADCADEETEHVDASERASAGFDRATPSGGAMEGEEVQAAEEEPDDAQDTSMEEEAESQQVGDQPTAVSEQPTALPMGPTETTGRPATSPFLESLRPPSPGGSKPVFGEGRITQSAFPTVPLILQPPSAASLSAFGTAPAPTPARSLFGSGTTGGGFSFAGLSSTGAGGLSTSATSGAAAGAAPSIFKSLGAPTMFGAGSTGPGTPKAGGIFGATTNAPKVMGSSIFGTGGSTGLLSTPAPSGKYNIIWFVRIMFGDLSFHRITT